MQNTFPRFKAEKGQILFYQGNPPGSEGFLRFETQMVEELWLPQLTQALKEAKLQQKEPNTPTQNHPSTPEKTEKILHKNRVHNANHIIEEYLSKQILNGRTDIDKLNGKLSEKLKEAGIVDLKTAEKASAKDIQELIQITNKNGTEEKLPYDICQKVIDTIQMGRLKTSPQQALQQPNKGSFQNRIDSAINIVNDYLEKGKAVHSHFAREMETSDFAYALLRQGINEKNISLIQIEDLEKMKIRVKKTGKITHLPRILCREIYQELTTKK